MKRRTLGMVLPALLILPALTAYAGGWATITVEDLPDHLVASRPATLTFMVRQHGVRPLSGLKTSIEARSGDAEVKGTTTASRTPGRYTATLTLPRAGDWTITIHSGFGRSSAKLLPIQAVDAAASATVLSQAERGKRLFVAKGCVSCHVHGIVNVESEVGIGADLTNRRYQADYLAQFLANPSIGAPTPSGNGAKMPDLELKRPEIAALVAFLNGGRQGQAQR